jgi:hypothetical protein
MVLDQRRE